MKIRNGLLKHIGYFVVSRGLGETVSVPFDKSPQIGLLP